MKNRKPTVLITGPKIGTASGISTHIETIINSKLKEKYNFIISNAGKGNHKEKFISFSKRIYQDYISFSENLKLADLVHINTAFTEKAILRDTFYCKRALKKKKKIVIQFHSGKNIDVFFKNNINRILFRSIYQKSHAFIFLSKQEIKSAIKYLRKDKLYQIYNGVKIDFRGLKEEKKFNKNKIILGYIGRIEKGKGLLECIETIKILKKEMRYPVTFQIAGTGSEETFLKKIVKKYDLEDSVKFLGFLAGKQKIDFWNNIDIFLFPTKLPEGIPYSFLESAASGTPIIATKSGSLEELIELMPECRVVESGNVFQIVENVIYLADNIEIMKTISENLKKKAAKYFSLDNMIKKIDKCYTEMLDIK